MYGVRLPMQRLHAEAEAPSVRAAYAIRFHETDHQERQVMSAKKKAQPKVERPANPVTNRVGKPMSNEERIRILEKRIEELERHPRPMMPPVFVPYPVPASGPAPMPYVAPGMPWWGIVPPSQGSGVCPGPVHPTVTW
jgi:hypothetical protein